MRLVSPDGDVIWTSTQESKGAKYKGASADVADKCVKQLLRTSSRSSKPKLRPTARQTRCRCSTQMKQSGAISASNTELSTGN